MQAYRDKKPYVYYIENISALAAKNGQKNWEYALRTRKAKIS